MKHPSFRKLLLLSFLTFTLLSLSAQRDSTSLRKNSITVNINGLLSQVFSNSNSSQSFLIYRRHFQKWNLRIGLSGYYQSREIHGAEPIYFDNSSSRIGLRAGFELPLIKFKRWQGYVGIDGVGGLYQYSNLAPYDNGVILERSGYTWSFGASPVLGLNFQLNQLIGFGVESSYDVLLETGMTTNEYTYQGGVFQIENEYHSGIITSYGSPLRLNLRICF